MCVCARVEAARVCAFCAILSARQIDGDHDIEDVGEEGGAGFGGLAPPDDDDDDDDASTGVKGDAAMLAEVVGSLVKEA